MGPLSAVDEYWALIFRSSQQEVWLPGVVVTPHTGTLSDYRGVFLFKRGDACRLSAPAPLVEPLREGMAGLGVDRVFVGSALLQILDDRVEQVIGPSWYGYVERARFRPTFRQGCRAVTESDAASLAMLRSSCGEEDWEESSFDRASALFGYFEDNGDLVAASNLTGWRSGKDSVGVVTRPDRRGRGYGATVASAAIAAALQETEPVEWRARGTNTSSIQIAIRLGFEPYGQSLAIRLR